MILITEDRRILRWLKANGPRSASQLVLAGKGKYRWSEASAHLNMLRRSGHVERALTPNGAEQRYQVPLGEKPR